MKNEINEEELSNLLLWYKRIQREDCTLSYRTDSLGSGLGYGGKCRCLENVIDEKTGEIYYEAGEIHYFWLGTVWNTMMMVEHMEGKCDMNFYEEEFYDKFIPMMEHRDNKINNLLK